MTGRTPAEALAAAVSLLVDGLDAVGALNALAGACATALRADAVGILVTAPPPAPFAPDLLAASSHEAAALELYQLQIESGPCYDAITQDVDVLVADADELSRRWPGLAQALVAHGLGAAHAWPMRWHGTAFGALNVFGVPPPLTPEERALGRGLADVAAATVAHADDRRDIGEVARAVRATVEDRALVERAKGVLRQVLDVDAGAAFAALAGHARSEGVTVTAVARELLATMGGGQRPAWLTPSP